MKFRIPTSICPMLIIFLLMLMPHAALADYDYFSDRISREHRDAGDVEDWIERGNATVTASPRFENGIRLTAWANESDKEEDYEFAIASAIYLFEIPRQAQYVEILVRYRGEPHRADFDYEEIAGRVWIRNTKREYARRNYNDNGQEETLYGDTFFLRAKRRSETIKIATAGHVDNGILEMHIVAENGEQLDIEYVDVVTYQRQPDVRVIHRYARDYHWQPWYRYTYLYFYDGPFYYCTDLGYYIRWSYPVYDHHYIGIRHTYGGYLHNYYRRYPRRYHRNSYYHVDVHIDKSPKTRRLNRWTPTHETTRREYSRSRLSVTKSKANRTNIQTRVRTLITEHRQTPVLSDRVIQGSTISRKRRLPDTRNGSNPTIQQQRGSQRSAGDTSARSYRPTQRRVSGARDESNTTIQRQRGSQRSAGDTSTRSYRPTQQRVHDTRDESNTTIQRQRGSQRSGSDTSARSYRPTQRRVPSARDELDTTIQRQRSNQRSASGISPRSYRSTQQILKRKRLSSVERESRSSVQPRNAQSRSYQYDRFRFSPKDKRSSDSEVSTRSNAERRMRLYNRTQSSSRSRVSTPPSRSRSSSTRQQTETRSRFRQSRSRSSTSTAPRIQRPTTQQTTSSSSSKDDDDEKRERTRSTTRTQTRSRRK